MRKGNLFSGLLLLALGGYVIVKAMRFPKPMDNTPGPGLFPILVAIALIVLVLLMLWENRTTTDNKPVVDIKSPDFHRAVFVVLALVAYIILLPLLGFLIATPLGLLGIMLIVNRQAVLMKLLATGLATGALYGVFHTLLQVPLP